MKLFFNLSNMNSNNDLNFLKKYQVKKIEFSEIENNSLLKYLRIKLSKNNNYYYYYYNNW